MHSSCAVETPPLVLAPPAFVHALMARYRDKFGGYAFHMLGNREDAQEALQDSFVRAYRALGSCRQPERFGAWLFRILTNRAVSRALRACLKLGC